MSKSRDQDKPRDFYAPHISDPDPPLPRMSEQEAEAAARNAKKAMQKSPK